jgi:hypothetical protein
VVVVHCKNFTISIRRTLDYNCLHRVTWGVGLLAVVQPGNLSSLLVMESTRSQDHQTAGSDNDPLDALLGLEESYYAEGYILGQEDGRKAGLAEGRAFGMERSFEKYAAMGRMHGRAVVWTSRSMTSKGAPSVASNQAAQDADSPSDFLPSTQIAGSNERSLDHSDDKAEALSSSIQMNPLSEASRLANHVRILWGLTEPESLNVANEEEGVSNFDDRLKRAVAKAKIIGKMVGEDPGVSSTSSTQGLEEPGGPKSRGMGAEVGIEDIDILKVRH